MIWAADRQLHNTDKQNYRYDWNRYSSCWAAESSSHYINIFILFLSFAANVVSHVQTDGTTIDPTSNDITEHSPAETVCLTEGCLRASESIQNYLDESVDPCENFYEFACGNYIKNTIIPKGRGAINMFTDIEDMVREQLRPIIGEPPQPNEAYAIQLAKHFYASCVHDEKLAEERTIEQIVDILDQFGGWPVVTGDLWQPSNFDWIETLKRFRWLGLDYSVIFAMNIEMDPKNSSRRVLFVS